MLIIAIPKSASTSLMITLGKSHNFNSVQDFSIKKNKFPVNSKVIHTVHSDIRELLQENVDKFNQNDTIFKQHIFPSDNNLKLLKKVKKVVLLREPKDILYAYLRGAKNKHNGLPDGYLINKLTKRSILKKAKADGFFDDICFFGDQWKKKANPDYTLFVYYEDYIRNTKGVINNIELFFGLSVTKIDIKPVQARYSRNNFIKKFMIKNIIYLLDKLKLKKFVKRSFKK